MLGILGFIKGNLIANYPTKYNEQNFKPGELPITHEEPKVMCNVYFCDTSGSTQPIEIFGEVDANTFNLDLDHRMFLYEGDVYYIYNSANSLQKMNSTNKYVSLSNYRDAYGDSIFGIKEDGTLWNINKQNNTEVQIGTDTDWQMISATPTFDEYYGEFSTNACAIKANKLVRILYTSVNNLSITDIDTEHVWKYIYGQCSSFSNLNSCMCIDIDNNIYTYGKNDTTWELKSLGTVSDIKEIHNRILISSDNTLTIVKDSQLTTVNNSNLETPWLQIADFGDTVGGWYVLNTNGNLYRLSYSSGSLSLMATNCCGFSGVYEYFLHSTMYIQNNDIYIGGSNGGSSQPTFYKKTDSADFVRGWGGSWMYPTIVLKKISPES